MDRELLSGDGYKEIEENVFMPNVNGIYKVPTIKQCDDVAAYIMLELAEVVRPIPTQITIGSYTYVCHNGLYYRPEVLDAMFESEDIVSMAMCKQWEMNTSLLITELLYLSEAYRDYVSKSDLVSRTVRAKIDKVTLEFLHHIEDCFYVKVSVQEATFETKGLLGTMLSNTITEMQKESLELFASACDSVLSNYAGNRITLKHYLTLVESEVARRARNLMATYAESRRKIQNTFTLKEGQ